MGLMPLDKLPHDPDRLALRNDARTTLAAYRSFLANPAFIHRIDLAVLTKIAGDEAMPVRERRRAAEMLGKLFVQVMGKMADLACVREQTMDELGLDDKPTAVAVTQVNTKVEIVRQDDWRSATFDAEVVDGDDGGRA